MSYLTSNTLKIFALTGLMILFIGLPLGNVHSVFAETTLDTDFVITVDPSRSFNDEAEMFNNFLNVFTAAYIAADGNLEVVALDENTICLSAQNGSCTREAAPHNPDLATKVKSKKSPVRIMTAYDQ